MPFTAHRRTMFVVLCLVYQLVFLQAVVMTTVANDVMRDMNLTPAGMGMLGSAYLYAYAFVMLASGMVAAWLGPRTTLSVLYVISGAGGLIFAWSASLETAMLGRALCGMGMAATMTAAFTLFGRWYRPGDFSRVCALFFSIGGLGTLVGIGVMAPLNVAWGWRAVFLFVSVLTLVYAAAVFLVVRDWPPEGVAELAGVEGAVRERPSMRLLWTTIRQVAKSRDFWRIIVWFICLVGSYFAFCGLWAVPYLKDVYAMSDNEAAGIVSLVAFGFIIGTPLISSLSDRVLKSYRVAPGAAGLVTFACMGYMIWNIDGMDTVLITVLIVLIGAAFNAPNACMYAAARNLFGTRMAGITGGVFGCSGFLGGAVMQVLCGWILKYGETSGWSAGDRYAAAFVPFMACGLVGAAAAFSLSRGSFKAEG